MYKLDVYESRGDDLGEIVMPQVPVVDKIRTKGGTIYRVTSGDDAEVVETTITAATLDSDYCNRSPEVR